MRRRHYVTLYVHCLTCFKLRKPACYVRQKRVSVFYFKIKHSEEYFILLITTMKGLTNFELNNCIVVPLLTSCNRPSMDSKPLGHLQAREVKLFLFRKLNKFLHSVGLHFEWAPC
jgi:hypothetical protein